MPIHQALLSFNGGEIAPYAWYLTGFSKWSSSCARLENFLPMPFGGIRKRPGLLHVCGLPADTRLHTFNFSAGEQYLIGFTTEACLIIPPDGTGMITIPGSFPAPYDMQFTQVNDYVYFVDGQSPPRQLTRTAAGAGYQWEISEIPFKNPPLLDENDIEALKFTTSFGSGTPAAWAIGTVYAVGQRVDQAGTIWAANKAHTATAYADGSGPPGSGSTYDEPYWVNGGTRWAELKYRQKPLWTQVFVNTASTPGQAVTVTSSIDYFNADHVGSVFRISKKRSTFAYEVDFEAKSGNDNKTSAPLIIQGTWTFMTFGKWGGSFTLEISRDNGDTWTDLRTFSAAGDRNVAPVTGDEPNRCLMRIRWNDATTATETDARGVLSSGDSYIHGLVKITGVTNAKTATGVSLTSVEATSTEFWTEGAFSPIQGWPAAIGVHEGRLVFAGTRNQPLSIWMSAADDIDNFNPGTKDDDSIFRTLRAVQQDPIRWICSQRRLFIGTAAGEWVVGSENSDNPLTPANFAVREHTAYGSSYMPAMKIGDGVFFIERQGRRVRELAYDITRESYTAADLTRLAEHLTESGIVQAAFQSNREPYLWAVRGDGTALTFAYSRPEEIAAWTRQTFPHGRARSVAVLRNEAGDDDVYFTIQRGDSFHLEKLASGQQLAQEAMDYGAGSSNTLFDCHHVDGITAATDDGDGHSVTLPEWFHEGERVHTLADGIFRILEVDGERKIRLPASCQKVHAGHPVTSLLTTLPQDVQAQNGSTHARRKGGHKLQVNTYNSWGGSYAYNGGGGLINYTHAGDPLDSAPVMRSGWNEVTLPAGTVEDLQVSLIHTEPYPFILRAAVLTWELTETL